MKREKDIFDLFRRNQHKLDERPSNDAWERLESRLDDHQKRSRPSLLYRQMTMAAAVLLLIGLVSVLSLYMNPARDGMANIELTPAPKILEDLPVYTDAGGGKYRMVEYQRRINTNPRSIPEGGVHKKLVAQTNTPIITNDHHHIAMDTPTKDIHSSSHGATSVSAYETVASTTTSSPIEQPETESVIAMNMEEMEKSEGMPEVDHAYDVSTSTYSEEEMVLKEKAEEAKKEEAHKYADRKAKSKKARKQERTASSAAPKRTLDAATNAIEFISEENQPGLDQFNWLIGKWTGNANEAQSVEQWRQTDEFTIEGKGYLIVNGKTTFTEEMSIQKIGQDLYYMLILDNTGQQVRYKLKTYQNQQAVFENNEVAFPKQVILNKTDNNEFSTILQNAKPVDINRSQQSYFSNRNFIRPEQVERNLRRSSDK